jgi:putative ABC transport system permease protein
VSALTVDGSTGFSVALPTVSLLVTLALGVLAGVLAAARPARRAACLDVLEAIASE